MKRLAKRLVVPVASAVLGAFATLAACLPEEAEPDHPIMPIGGPAVSSGTGGGGGDTGVADAGAGANDGGGFGDDADVGFDFDAGVGFGDGGGFGDVGTVPLDAAPADAGTILIPSDGGGAPPFPEGDQIP